MPSLPDTLEIDGSYKRKRYMIKVDGQTVWIPGKAFKYLTRLVWAKKNKLFGWVHKTDIEPGFYQARYIYRMKAYIKAGLSAGSVTDWAIVENNHLGYYRIDIPADRISIHDANLKAHPDFAVSSLFDDEVIND